MNTIVFFLLQYFLKENTFYRYKNVMFYKSFSSDLFFDFWLRKKTSHANWKKAAMANVVAEGLLREPAVSVLVLSPPWTRDMTSVNHSVSRDHTFLTYKTRLLALITSKVLSSSKNLWLDDSKVCAYFKRLGDRKVHVLKDLLPVLQIHSDGI